MTKSKMILAVLASTTVALSWHSSYGQQAKSDADKAGELEELVVTAQKREENISDVPLSITAATGTKLGELGIMSAADLPKIVPGMTFAKSTYGAPIFTIRGIGTYDEAVAISPTVSVYVDQAPLPVPRMAEAAGLDIERVEVLKGPQGTLFGENSTGGAINYIAAKPTNTFQAGTNVSYGRFNDVDIQGHISGPVSKTLNARVAIRSEQADDWQQSETSNRARGQKDFFAGRILLDWNPTESLAFELNSNAWRDKSDTQAPQYQKYSAITPTAGDVATAPGIILPPSFSPGFTGSIAQPNLDQLLRQAPVVNTPRAADWDPNFPKKRDDWFYQFALHGDLQLADRLTLTSITGYDQLRVDSPAEVDGTQYLNLNTVTTARVKAFTQEVRLGGASGDSHVLKYMIGGNYEHDDTSDRQNIIFDGTNTGLFKGTPIEFRYTGNGAGLFNESNQRIDVKAAFGSLDYDLTDTLTAQGAVRYTKERRNFDACMRDNGQGLFGQGFGLLSNVLNGSFSFPNPGDPGYIAPGGCATLDDVTNRPIMVHRVLNESNTSWRMGLSWKATSDIMLYANATRGFKSGNFGTLPLIRVVQSDPVPQEKVTAYEVGFKAGLLKHKLDVDGAVFYYDYVAKQLLGYVYTGAVFGDLPGEVSIPKSRVEGAELNVMARPLEELELRGGATYVDSKVSRDYRITTPDSLYAYQPGDCGAGKTVGDCGVNINGSPFPYTPKWTLLADAQFSRLVSDDLKGFVGVNVVYHSKTIAEFGAPPNGLPAGVSYTSAQDYVIQPYALVDLRAGMESGDGKWRVQLWGRNVFDKYYWLHVVKIQDTLARVTGMPATYGVTVSMRF